MYDHGGMNRFYRLVWSEAKGCYIPIPEVSQKRGKRKGGVFASLAAAALALLSAATGALADPGPQVSVAPAAVMQQLPPADNALPTGGTVVGGNATISQSGNTQTITQTSQNAAIDWQSFDIGKDGKVIFNQPNASAIALNRVLGGDASKIYGVLQANGQVFLVNPNGVLFAKGAQVSAAAIMASTRDISVADFMAGKYRLSGTSNGTIVNDGTLTAGEGGYVALVGAQVVNTGTISAAKGEVRLVAANEVTVRLDTGGLDLTIDQGGYDALVSNGGIIKADNGRIYLTAAAFDALAKASVNNSGIIEAAGVANVGGKIVLTGSDLTLAEGSKIDASGDLGGGTVLVGGGWQGKDSSVRHADTVSMASGAVIDVSAKTSGNGGTTVLWSEGRTDFGGQINAKGGIQGGDGGQIETSGHMLLDVTGSVDASSAKGEYGQWLLDPYNVIIASSGASGTAYSGTYNPATDSVILASSIQSGLSNANVTITTGASGGSAGDITLNAPINRSGNTQTLTLLAANDIIINNTINSAVGSLNVVLTADSDNSGAGSIQFTSAGKVITNGGNFFAGNLTSSSQPNANQKRGQDFTMAAGSQIDAGGAMLDINVNGNITLAENSIRNGASYCCVTAKFNDGTTLYASNYLSLNGASITSINPSATTGDIYSRVGVTLTASGGDIGSSSHALNISGGDALSQSNAYSTLTVSNSGGSTWINEIGAQHATSMNISIGSQLNSEHHIDFQDDANGTGKGHIDLTTDGTGAVQVAAGGVRMGGNFDWDTYEGVYPVNLTLSAGTVHFASGAVDMGSASLTVNAGTMTGTNDGVADIIGGGITLTGGTIGTTLNPLELEDNYLDQGYLIGSLTLNNSGGGTAVKSLNNGFGSLTFDYAKAVGVHSVLFSGGDHIDFVTDGAAVYTPTITGGASDGQTFGATTGIDVSRGWRNLTINSRDGDIILGDDSIRMGGAQLYWGDYYNTVLTLGINRSNTTGVIAAENAYNAGAQVAQITGGDVTLSASNDPTPTATTIGAGGKDIQVAEAAGSVNSKLTVSLYQGNVSVHELTQNHFKSIAVSLGDAQTNQTVAIDLKGADDINFNDDGSLIVVDATKVAVSDNNRSFSLSAGQRAIRTDGNALTTGGYSLSGKTLNLNGDVITNGGDISLGSSHGTNLLASVLVDSNSDHQGNSGTISVNSNYTSYNGSISATGAGRTLTLHSYSTDALGGNIYVSDMVDNRAGAYLGGLFMDARSAGTGQDASVNLSARNVLLDGGFSAYGATSIGYYNVDFILRTAASNSGNAGNIIFGGDSLYHQADRALTFNASTTANGGNGGTIDLFTTLGATSLKGTTLSATANAGAGGTKGAITLGAVATSSTQTYSGSSITLNGDLTTANAAMTLTGPVYFAESATLKSGSGAMSLGTLSATASGIGATIGSTSDSGALSSLSADNGAGHYLDTLTVASTAGRSVALGNVATEGTQTYSNGSVTIGGALSTNGGNISLSGITTLNNLSGNVSFDTDRAGGTNNAGQLIVGSKALNGTGTLVIDTTADGGGANAAVTLSGVGATTAFSSIDIKSGATTLNGVVRTSGNLLLEAQGATADITLGSSGRAQTTGTSNTVILSAGRNFVNNAASNTGIQVGAGSRYLVYSANPANSSEGMTGYDKHYNEVYANGVTPSYASSGNWFLYSVAPVISVSSNATSVVYGAADPSLTLSASNYSGFIDGDSFANLSGSQTLSLAAAGTLSGAGMRQVGTYAYTLNGTVTDSLGYQYALFSENLTVTPASIAVSGLSAVNRDYDGTTAVTLTGTPSAGSALSGDVVTVDVSGIVGSVADKNAGTAKSVIISGSGGLTGTDAGNYQLTPPVGLTVDIAKKTLTIAGSTAAGKTYDGTNLASVNAGTLSGFVGTETVTVTAAGTFADKNAGSGKSVTTTYALADGTHGGLAANYQLAGETLSADIAKKTLTMTGSTVTGKTYDGSDAATVTAGTLSGFVGTETVTAAAAGTFADKNAGNGKSVAATYSLANGTNGGLAANYELAGQTLSGDITAKALGITGSSVTGKTYDGSASATVVAGTLTGLIGSESLSVTGAGTFADANAGAGKTVTATYTLSDSTGLAANYTLAGQSLTGDIAKKTLSITGSAVTTKTYDRSTSATITAGTLTGLVGSETLTVGASGSFGDWNAGTNKAVVTAYTLGNGTHGGLAANYELGSETLFGAIAKKTISLVATGQNKTYNGSEAISVTVASNDIVLGDTVTFTGTGAASDKNAGLNKTVNVTGIATNSSDAANYDFATTAATTVDIARKAVTVTATGQNKTYDGQASVGVTLASTGIVHGDTVTFTGTGAASDKNAGTGKTVSVSGIGANGADAGNYDFNTTASTTADIAKKTVVVAATGQDKTYDGGTIVGVTLVSADVVTGDSVVFTGAGALMDKNAGSAKAVTVTGIAATGADAANYDFATTAAATANVTKKSVTVTATGQNKVYDGNASVGVILDSTGILNGDMVSFTGTGSASDKNAGHHKTVAITGIAATGADAGNYDFATTGSTTVDIAKKAISVTATGQNKTYDGSSSVDVSLTSHGIVSGDSVGFTGTGTALNKNAGMGKTVMVGNFAITGTDAGNYDATAPVATTVDIAKKAISVSAAANNKTYDGQATVDVALSSQGVVAGDSMTFSGTGAASDKNAGTGKTVTIGNFAVGGTDARNYNVTAPVSTTVDIAKKAITVAAASHDKTYDGQALVGVDLASGDIVSGDTVTFTGTALASDKNAGIAKSVSVSGISASGTDAGNYTYNTTAATTVDIARKAVVVTASGQNKIYDGSNSIGVDLASDGIVDGDTVIFAGSGKTSDKTAGTAKTVAVSNIAATGADARNYTYNTTAATTADIARKTVTIDAQGLARTYDGSTAVDLAVTSADIVEGDSVTFTGTGKTSDKTAGAGKSVAVSNITASGADADNYAYATTGTTTVDIAKKAVTVQASAQNKTYDGSGAVQVSLSSNDIVAGDSVIFSGTGMASDKNAGAAKTVTVGNVAATGTDAENYAFAQTALTTVDIATRDFTVSLHGPISKTGDGTTSAALNSGNYQVAGLVEGETITVNQTAGTFADAMAGKNKTVTAQIAAGNYAAGANTDLSNYTLASFTLATDAGEIVSPTSPGYDSALNTAVTNPAVAPPGATHQVAGPAAAPAVSTGEGDNAVAAVSDGGKDQTSAITPVESREALTFRRTFAIADGGIRLPEGVSETDSGSDSK